MSIGTTTLLFISTAIIFWVPNYGENVLKANHDQVLAVFVIVSISGPVLGIIVGGAIVDNYAGGYEGKKSSLFTLFFAVMAVLCSLPVKMISNIYMFGLCLWGVLFFGGAVIPNAQGIMISSLKPELRAVGNSISVVLQCLLGFIPAPFVYGVIYNYSKSYDQKLAIALVLWYSIVGVLFYVVGTYYRFKKMEEEEERDCIKTTAENLKNDKNNINVQFTEINESEKHMNDHEVDNKKIEIKQL